jgi:nickel-dependent lactate racemase
MHEIELTTAAWYEEQRARFQLPDRCTVDVLAPCDHSALTDDEIARVVGPALAERIQSFPATARVLFVVDDLGRPTPAWQIIPVLLKRLEARGIPKANIQFLIATGSHRQLERSEMAKKLGTSIVERFQVVSHDACNSPMTHLGKLHDGFPCVVNRMATAADLLVGIGCVMPHSCHGFGGGAKLFLPGIAAFESIGHLHGLIAKRGRGNGTARYAWRDMRTVSEAFADRLPPIFLVNVVVNSRREIAGVFAGDFRKVYQQACTFAARVYSTPIKKAAIPEYHLVIANAYPLDADPVQSNKGRWIARVFKNALVIYVNACRDGIDYHGWKEWRRRAAWRRTLLWPFQKIERAPIVPVWFKRLWQRGPLAWLRNAVYRWLLLSFAVDYPTYRRQSATTRPNPSMSRVKTTPHHGPWFYSPHYTAEQYRRKYKQGTFWNDWEAMRSALEQRFPDCRIAVLPCAPLQIPEIES